MKIKKIFFWILIIISSIIFSTTFALAQTGCFLYPESPFYCSDLSLEKAEAECLLYQDCDLTSFYYSQESCTNKIKFSECKVILCKDTCQNEVIGKCLSGEIPITEKDQWCNPGCCYFEYYQNHYCNHEETKTVCETEARNKDVDRFSFNSKKNQAQCLNFCANQEYSNPLISSNLVFEDISLKNEDVVSFNELNRVHDSEEIKEKPEEKKETEEKNNLPWILLISILLFSLIAYIYKKPRLLKSLLNAIFLFLKSFKEKLKNIIFPRRKEKQTPIIKKWERILLPFNSSPKLRRLIFWKTKEREHKIKEFHSQEVLDKFGPTKNLTFKEKQAKIKDLKKLVSSYERKLKYHPKEISKQEISAIQKLEQLTELKVESFANMDYLEKNEKANAKLLSNSNDGKTKDILSELKSIANKENK